MPLSKISSFSCHQEKCLFPIQRVLILFGQSHGRTCLVYISRLWKLISSFKPGLLLKDANIYEPPTNSGYPLVFHGSVACYNTHLFSVFVCLELGLVVIGSPKQKGGKTIFEMLASFRLSFTSSEVSVLAALWAFLSGNSSCGFMWHSVPIVKYLQTATNAWHGTDPS